ncbi:hypothetical protein GCM10027258_14070 [Amycolatopsis stemonae]
MKARGWTSRKVDGHGGEVTDMQRTAYSARCAAGVPSGTASPNAEDPERAGEYQV